MPEHEDVDPRAVGSIYDHLIRRIDLGAEIGGVDLRYPLSTRERDEVKAALVRYQVVFFLNQK